MKRAVGRQAGEETTHAGPKHDHDAFVIRHKPRYTALHKGTGVFMLDTASVGTLVHGTDQHTGGSMSVGQLVTKAK